MSKQSNAIRYTANTARILLGAAFVFFGFGYFFMTIPAPDTTTVMGQFSAGLAATVYFMPFLKTVEGLCGLMLFFKRTTPLALIVLAPIVVNIALVGIFIDKQALPIAAIITVFGVFLAWFNWDKFAGIFKA